ncbi:MAG: ATP-binding protein [Bifidobacteriaceae bacterium]|jgi:hypothetical protein|nr:ATP-binding protein [Bifidobacteriaceae bacterium]
MGNPFTPTFGSEPLFLVGRDRMINDVIEGLGNRPGDPNRSTLFVGPRGSGKTVLLAKIAEAAQVNGWVAARVTASPTPDRDSAAVEYGTAPKCTSCYTLAKRKTV